MSELGGTRFTVDQERRLSLPRHATGEVVVGAVSRRNGVLFAPTAEQSGTLRHRLQDTGQTIKTGLGHLVRKPFEWKQNKDAQLRRDSYIKVGRSQRA